MPVRWQKTLLIACFLLFAFVVFAYQESLVERAEVGRPAPDFELEAADGSRWRLSDHQGSVVFLNFWTSWCDVCREEEPALATFYERYGDRVVQVGINWKEPWPVIRPYLRDRRITYTVLSDADGDLAKRYRLQGVPENWMIGEDGVARLFWTGQSFFETIQEAYERVSGRSIDEGDGGPVPPGGTARGLVWEPPGNLWLAAAGGLYRSGDGGRSWQENSFWQSREVRRLAASDDALFVIDGEAGVWRSVDSGGNWEQLSAPDGVEPSAITAGNGTLFLAAEQGRIFRAPIANAGGPDGIGAWEELTGTAGDAGPSTIQDLAWHDGTLTAAAGAEGLWRVRDGRLEPLPLHIDRFTLPQRSTAGTTPTRTVPLPVYGISGAAGATASPVLWLASETGIWIWDTGAASGEASAERPARRFADVAVDPSRPERLWAVAPNGDLYRSGDRGRSWEWVRR